MWRVGVAEELESSGCQASPASRNMNPFKALRENPFSPLTKQRFLLLLFWKENISRLLVVCSSVFPLCGPEWVVFLGGGFCAFIHSYSVTDII